MSQLMKLEKKTDMMVTDSFTFLPLLLLEGAIIAPSFTLNHTEYEEKYSLVWVIKRV